MRGTGVAERADGAGDRTAAAAGAAPPTVLLVESDAALAEQVRRWLRAECGDVRVAVAADARAALPLLARDSSVDAVLLDVGPHGRGHALRLARALRRRFGRRLPIVATFPGGDDAGDVEELRALGIDLLVGKADGRPRETADELGRIALTLLLSQELL